MTTPALQEGFQLPPRLPRTRRVAAIIAFFMTLTLIDGLVSPLLAGVAFSDWPSRSVRVIVPFPAGSAIDLAARAYAERLSRRWARPVVIEPSSAARPSRQPGTITLCSTAPPR